jgi:hypothetical protein
MSAMDWVVGEQPLSIFTGVSLSNNLWQSSVHTSILRYVLQYHVSNDCSCAVAGGTHMGHMGGAQVAGQPSGVNIVDKAQAAVNTFKVISALNDISDLLKVRLLMLYFMGHMHNRKSQ